MNDSNFGLEDFSTYAARRENQSVPTTTLRDRYDAAVKRREAEMVRQNDEARQQRLKAEAKVKQEAEAQRAAEAHEKGLAHEAALKDRARRSWPGTAESFEAAWPAILQQTLIDEARQSDAALRAALRREYARNF